MAIRHLIFDLDGTLIDSSKGVVEATNYALRQVGCSEVAADRIKLYIGYPLETMFADFTDAPITELRYHFQIKAAESVVASAVQLDGVSQALQEMDRMGFAMAIATTKIRYHVDAIIAKFGWQTMFPVAVAGNEVARVKPEPDAFLLALERLEARPEETLVIGDTVNDILAAQAIPMKVAAVASPYGGHERVQVLRPDYFVSGISELVELLRAEADGSPSRTHSTRRS